MNKKLKRILSRTMASMLLIGTLAACGKDSENKGDTSTPTTSSSGGVDTSQEVTLKMYLLGDKPADMDDVYGKINEELKDKINATVDVSFLSWAEHGEKYSLLFSSGEDFDLIFTASGWAHYETTSTKKGFYDMTEDFRNTYAPDIIEVVPAEAWEQARINGNVYMVPNYNIEFGENIIAVRGDLMEKYGFDSISSQAELEAFCDAIAENETDITPFGSQGMALGYPYMFESLGQGIVRGTPEPFVVYNNNDATDLEVLSLFETEHFREYAHKMKEMADKGYWTRDALSTQGTTGDPFKQGKAALCVWNLGTLASYCEEVNKENPDWNCTLADISPDIQKVVNPYTNNGMAINAASKNPERAMMAINEFMTNKVIYDLASYGIDGVHYEAVGDDQYTPLDATDRFPIEGVCNWGWNNENLKRSRFEENPDPVRVLEVETFNNWVENQSEVHPVKAFSFDQSKVKNECAVIETLYVQYANPIMCGFVDDPDASVDELVQKLKEAGMDKVMEEVQTQVDALQ